MFLLLQLLAREGLPGRAAKRVTGVVVSELCAVEQRSISLAVDPALSRNMGQDALDLAGLRLGTVGVTTVSHHVKRRRIANRLPGRLCHGQQTALVAHFRSDLLRNDQRMFGVHRSLQVIGRGVALTGTHKTSFWFWITRQLLQRSRYCTGVDDRLL